jgi:hypothetical protein
MTAAVSNIFGENASAYRDAGFWPRPVVLGEKRPPMKNWQLPDSEIPPEILRRWLHDYAELGIGVAMGSLFPDGSRLGALDIDDDRFIRLAKAALMDPPSGRIGARGIVYFVRVAAEKPNRNFAIKSGEQTVKVGELLVDRKFCVLPPTIHPNGNPYTWVGSSLLDVDYTSLPLIED